MHWTSCCTVSSAACCRCWWPAQRRRSCCCNMGRPACRVAARCSSRWGSCWRGLCLWHRPGCRWCGLQDSSSSSSWRLQWLCSIGGRQAVGWSCGASPCSLSISWNVTSFYWCAQHHNLPHPPLTRLCALHPALPPLALLRYVTMLLQVPGGQQQHVPLGHCSSMAPGLAAGCA
jgi:hypothetical protein